MLKVHEKIKKMYNFTCNVKQSNEKHSYFN